MNKLIDWAFVMLTTALALLAGAVLVIAIVMFTASTCKADIISELGVVIKSQAQTSQILWPDCTTAYVTDAGLARSPGWTSCGGDNPMFLGWVIAWETSWDSQRAVRWRVGIPHISHWCDGGNVCTAGDDHEIFMTGVGASMTINWSRLLRKNNSGRDLNLRRRP